MGAVDQHLGVGVAVVGVGRSIVRHRGDKVGGVVAIVVFGDDAGISDEKCRLTPKAVVSARAVALDAYLIVGQIKQACEYDAGSIGCERTPRPAARHTIVDCVRCAVACPADHGRLFGDIGDRQVGGTVARRGNMDTEVVNLDAIACPTITLEGDLIVGAMGRVGQADKMLSPRGQFCCEAI